MSCDMETVEKLTSIASNFATSAALLVGGGWAFYHYVLDRIYHPKLESVMTLNVRHQKDGFLIAVKVTLKNVGASRIDLDHAASGIALSALVPVSGQGAMSARPTGWAMFDVFRRADSEHGGDGFTLDFVESGESISDVRLIALRPDVAIVGFIAALRVVGHRYWWHGTHDQSEWRLEEIALVDPVDCHETEGRKANGRE